MKRSEERRYSNYDNPRNEDSEHYPSYHENRNHLCRRKHRHKNYEQPRHERPYTLRDNDSKHYRSYNENGNHSYRRKYRQNKYEQPGHERSYTPRDNDSEHYRSYNENGNHSYRRRYRPKEYEQSRYERSYTPRDNADSKHYRSYNENSNHSYRRKHRQKIYEQPRYERSYTPRDNEESQRFSSEGNHHDYRRAKYKEQRGYRQSYNPRDAEPEEQATKHCPRTTDPPPCYKEVKAPDQAPVSPISKERLIDHQDKYKLVRGETAPAAKAIKSFINEFIKTLNEISTLNWNSFNSGSYYDKTKNCHPDEFDIMIYPNLSVEVNFDDMKIPGFYKVKMVSPRVKELEHVLDKNRYIVPDTFKQYVFGLFDRVLGPDGIPQGSITTKKTKPDGCSPAYTVFYNPFSDKEPIDIDLVPCFNIDGWPPDKITRKINPSWIAIDDVVNRAMKSYDVVCKTCPEDEADKNLLFRLSFSRTEKMLVNHANSADKLNLKKKVFRVIKLCIQDLKDKHPREIKKFCSYHIKQFMFSQFDTWPTRESKGFCIQRYLIGKLIHTLSVANPTIANYFITNDNVIRYVPSEEIAVIVKGLQDKVKLLY